tara:strand:+ start:269 stop:508 length:240 start_codon:yes stop_codon:yes gene_type:complete
VTGQPKPEKKNLRVVPKMDPATVKTCKGPCLYWCSEKNHNAARVCLIVMVFAAGVCVGALAVSACKRHQSTNNKKRKFG